MAGFAEGCIAMVLATRDARARALVHFGIIMQLICSQYLTRSLSFHMRTVEEAEELESGQWAPRILCVPGGWPGAHDAGQAERRRYTAYS